MKVKKVAITGPESTGKSWLAKELARHYHAPFIPEYARSYIDRLDRDYEAEDIVKIAKGQLLREQQQASSDGDFLFCDTELLVTKVWSLHKYGTCDPFILEQIKKNRYELFLLCDIDLPWEYDKQREHPDLREYFFEWYKRELTDYGFPFVIIRGINHQRLENAILAIDDFFKEPTVGKNKG